MTIAGSILLFAPTLGRSSTDASRLREDERLSSTRYHRLGADAEPSDLAAESPFRGQATGACIAFGPFRLWPRKRLLQQGGRALRLGSRALDILIALVERPGELVKKQELIARVWPGIVVEDGNLKVQVAALRRTLCDGQMGNRYICTVVGRGYCFVAPVAVSVEQMALAASDYVLFSRSLRSVLVSSGDVANAGALVPAGDGHTAPPDGASSIEFRQGTTETT